jgi:hypothetical protein
MSVNEKIYLFIKATGVVFKDGNSSVEAKREKKQMDFLRRTISSLFVFLR